MSVELHRFGNGAPQISAISHFVTSCQNSRYHFATKHHTDLDLQNYTQ